MLAGRKTTRGGAATKAAIADLREYAWMPTPKPRPQIPLRPYVQLWHLLEVDFDSAAAWAPSVKMISTTQEE